MSRPREAAARMDDERTAAMVAAVCDCARPSAAPWVREWRSDAPPGHIRQATV